MAPDNEIKSLISQKFELLSIDSTSIPKFLIIPSQIIVDIRMNANGSINKYKARLVSQSKFQDSSTFSTLLQILSKIKVSIVF